ncbi:MAG: DUF6034 family protein [Clostridia bacterium]|nr:DUF6034 family protein [Clostridia bacterium]
MISNTTSTVTSQELPSQRTSYFSTEEILLTVWLVGVGIGLMYLAILYALLKKQIRRNAITPSKRLIKQLEEVKAQLHIKGDVRILGQCEYGMPAILFPNKILMPFDTLISMRDEEVKYVLRHELMHFKRKDHLLSIVLSILNAVYWFNPIVWIAFKQIRSDMETACDSDVVRHFSRTEKTTYASIILSLFSKKQYGSLVVGMVQGSTRKIAEKRIKGVFMHHRTQPKGKIAALLLSLLLLFSCFTTACQPTPEKQIVTGKNPDSLEEKIGQRADSQDKGGSIQLSEITFTGADEIVTVHVDADARIPERMPVVQVIAEY